MRISGEKTFYRRIDKLKIADFPKAVKVLLVFNRNKYPVLVEQHSGALLTVEETISRLKDVKRDRVFEIESLFVNFAACDHKKVFIISLRLCMKPSKGLSELVRSVNNAE